MSLSRDMSFPAADQNMFDICSNGSFCQCCFLAHCQPHSHLGLNFPDFKVLYPVGAGRVTQPLIGICNAA